MVTLKSLKQKIEADLKNDGIEEASLDARLLISHIVPITEIDFAINGDMDITDDQYDAILKLVQKRLNRIPMSQIFGEKEFWSLNFKVTKDTLTPRPDSETLIEVALKKIEDKERPLSILHLGTGSGCLLLSLLSEFKSAVGVGVDISDEALKVACENSEKLLLNDRATFIQSNWFDGVSDKDKFDIIIANPPYIGLNEQSELAPEVIDHEPHTALFSGEKGLDDYNKIASEIPKFITKDGIIILEIGYQQARLVRDIFKRARFEKITIFQDLGGRDRCLLIEQYG